MSDQSPTTGRHEPTEQLSSHMAQLGQGTQSAGIVPVCNTSAVSRTPAIFSAPSVQGALMLQTEQLIHAAAATPPLPYLSAVFAPSHTYNPVAGAGASLPLCNTSRTVHSPAASYDSRSFFWHQIAPTQRYSGAVGSNGGASSAEGSVTDDPRQLKSVHQQQRDEHRYQHQRQQQQNHSNSHQDPIQNSQRLLLLSSQQHQQQHEKELRPSTSFTGIVERGVDQSLADAADQGPPAKKPRSMQSAGIQAQHQSPPKSVGQRIKETLQTSKSQLCRSPNAADTSLVSAPLSPPALGALQVSTIRIIGQYLKSLGLQETVATLFAESGCRLEDTLAVRLREYVLAGEWDHALGIVDKMAPYVTRPNLLRIREKLFEEKFVDLLSKERVLEALGLLTVDFPSDPAFFDRRNFLANLLYVDPKNVDVFAKTGAHRTRRERNALIADIQQLLPTSVMLPCNRLEKLLMQSWRAQCRDCYLHVREDVDITPDYILEDHQCDWDSFPMFTSQVLTKHTDEVWCTAFSNSGKFLATGSRSGSAQIWKVVNTGAVEPYKEFGRNSSSLLVWSDNDALLAISAAEGNLADVHVYDVQSGTTFCVIENRANDNTVMSFVPNSYPYRLVCADQMGHFCQYVLSKDSVKADGKFEGYRIRAVHCLRNGTVLAADTHNRVRSYRFSDDTEATLIEESSQIATFVVDRAERRILIDTRLHGLRLWDLKTRTLMKAFHGASHQDFIVHSTFGGLEQSYIASGSTDESVYVWKQNSHKPMARLCGHTARVNAVAWNPRLPQLVSCSDDCTVRIWSPINGIDASNIRIT